MQTQTTNEKPRAKRTTTPPLPERVSGDDGHTVILGVRVGRDRIAALDAKAKSLGMTRSEFLRWMLDVSVMTEKATIG